MALEKLGSAACREQMEAVERHLRLLIDGGTPVDQIKIWYAPDLTTLITVHDQIVFQHSIVFTVDGSPCRIPGQPR